LGHKGLSALTIETKRPFLNVVTKLTELGRHEKRATERDRTSTKSDNDNGNIDEK
jgi:hypothetical protein